MYFQMLFVIENDNDKLEILFKLNSTNNLVYNNTTININIIVTLIAFIISQQIKNKYLHGCIDIQIIYNHINVYKAFEHNLFPWII